MECISRSSIAQKGVFWNDIFWYLSNSFLLCTYCRTLTCGWILPDSNWFWCSGGGPFLVHPVLVYVLLVPPHSLPLVGVCLSSHSLQEEVKAPWWGIGGLASYLLFLSFPPNSRLQFTWTPFLKALWEQLGRIIAIWFWVGQPSCLLSTRPWAS